MAFDIGTAKAAAAARGVQAPPDYPGGPDAWVMEWFKNGIAAGDPDLQQRSGGMPGQRQAEGGGVVNDFSQAAGSADWLGKRKPTTQELRKWAKDTGRSEDYERFSDAAVSGMIDRNWDVNAGSFRNNYGDLVDKPDERGPNTPAGVNGTGDRGNYGAGGGGGGGGGGGYGGGASGYSAGPGGSAGGLPQFNAPTFTPPTAEQAFNDPGYQFALKEGVRGLEGSAAARGTLRTGGTLKDIMDYGQKAAAQQYGDVYNRAANTFGINYQGAKDEFAPQYGGWQTMYGGDLQKYLQGQQSDLSKWSTRYGGDLSRDLQRENNIYGLINQPPPAPPSWQS